MIFIVKCVEYIFILDCCILVGDVLEMERKGVVGFLGLVKWMLLFINGFCLVVGI